MNRHDLEKLNVAYTQVHEKKDSSYLETDMKKRQDNNEKARKDMAKVKGQKNPHFEEKQKESNIAKSLADAYRAVHEEGYGAPGHNPGSGEKSVARAKALMDKKGQKGAPGLDAMRAANKEHEARRGVKKEEVETVVEDDKSYDRNRKRAAQRAADRNAARAAGKTGVVPGVGYVTARKEKESYTDSKGVERHKSGAKNEEYELELDENRRAARAAGGYKDDSKKQNDPSKAGFTGVGNMSIDQIRKMSARMDKEKKESYDPMDDPDFDHDEAEKNRGVSGKNNPKGGKAVGKKKKMKEETVVEDAKMAKQSDEKLSALHKQVSSSDQSLPSNQFMLKRVQKEMNRRKKVTKEELEATGKFTAEEIESILKNDIEELYKGKHGQSEKDYQDSRSNAGKMISGDSKGSGANYSYKAKNTGSNPAGGSKKPQGQARMSTNDRAYLAYQKANLKKEELEGNPVYEATKGDIQEFVGAMLGNAVKGVAQGAVNSAGAALATPVGAALAGGTIGAVTGGKKKIKRSAVTGAGAAAGAALGGLPGAVVGGIAGRALS